MAHHSDYDGVYFTLQSLRLYQDLKDCEILIVDNDASSEHGKAVRALVDSLQGNDKEPESTPICPVRYLSFTDSTGTSATRNAIFDHARGEAVLVMDCHVQLRAGSVARLIAHYQGAPEEAQDDLFSGPLLTDDLQLAVTQWKLQWCNAMWGQWDVPLSADALMDPQAQPFEIEAQGLGLFSARRDSWLRFHSDFRFFGGEEGYIHEKYRRHGRRAMCLPWLQWTHRFARPSGVQYPVSARASARNVLIGLQSLGMSTETARKHFVEEMGLDPSVGAQLERAPVADQPFLPETGKQTLNDTTIPLAFSNLGKPLPLSYGSIQEVCDFLRRHTPGLDRLQHMLELLVKGTSSLLEISSQRESTALLLALISQLPHQAQTSMYRFRSHQSQRDTLLNVMSHALQPESQFLEWTDVRRRAHQLSLSACLPSNAPNESQRNEAQVNEAAPSVHNPFDAMFFGAGNWALSGEDVRLINRWVKRQVLIEQCDDNTLRCMLDQGDWQVADRSPEMGGWCLFSRVETNRGK